VELVDQSPIGKSPRSNPVTYVGAFDGIRRRLAATHSARSLGLDASAFSFNVRGGRCEACAGAGSTLVEMHFLPDVLVACSECGGRRFGARALGVRDRGRSVADILAMTVDEAMEFFGDDRHIARRLSPLVETGLGYLRLGQPATTLSGGEAQRLKLATHLGAGSPDGPRVFLLDEPTAGLHLDDLATLVRIFGRLLDGGHTIVVVEHHLDLILASDWVVDLGPGAGPEGGRLVAEGPPEVVARSTGITGRYVADALRAKR
jgi:excinuclease ABC subunit A